MSISYSLNVCKIRLLIGFHLELLKSVVKGSVKVALFPYTIAFKLLASC